MLTTATRKLRVNILCWVYLRTGDRLAGLVVKASASGAEDPGSNPAYDGIFSWLSVFKIGTPVATLPGAGMIG